MKIMILAILTEITVINILECESQHSKWMMLLLTTSTRNLWSTALNYQWN